MEPSRSSISHDSSQLFTSNSGIGGSALNTEHPFTKEKRIYLALILFTQLLSGIMILNVAFLYPLWWSLPEIRKSNPEYSQSISPKLIATAMGMFQLSAILTIPFHTVLIKRIGRKTCMILGLSLIFIYYMATCIVINDPPDSYKDFLVISGILRAIQGYGASLYQTTSFSIIASQFRKRKSEYIGYVELWTGYGFMVGPCYTTLMFTFFAGNQQLIFILQDVIILGLIIAHFFIIPTSINFDEGYDPRLQKRLTQVEKQVQVDSRTLERNETRLILHANPKIDKILAGYNLMKLEDCGIFTVLRSKSVWFAFMARSIGIYNVSFFIYFVQTHLLLKYKYDYKQIGWMISLVSFSYMFAALILPQFFKRYDVPRKITFIISFIFSAISIFFLRGENQILNGFGFGILGFMQALVLIPSLPEAMQRTQQKFRIVEGSDVELDKKLNDVMGSIFSISYNFSGLLSPIIGSSFYITDRKKSPEDIKNEEQIAWQSSMLTNGYILLVIAFLYLIFNTGNIFKKQQILLKDLRILKRKAYQIKDLDTEKENTVEAINLEDLDTQQTQQDILDTDISVILTTQGDEDDETEIENNIQ